MIIGIPKGLLYYKYSTFYETFFKELGAEILISENTNKNILDLGVKYCVDDACLPIKVFHGHVASIKDKCDFILIPRIMKLHKREFICPKFCGLPEMIVHSIPNMPPVLGEPIYAENKELLYKWAKITGSKITNSKSKINKAFNRAIENQMCVSSGLKDKCYDMNIALLGHPYNIYDNFVNMNLVKKLNNLGIGVITEENVNKQYIDEEVKELFKRPFWTFARNSFGAAVHLLKNKSIDGIVYISSFACGIDSVVIELIQQKSEDTPMLILKIDEQTGEAGFNTRVEAFVDMLERRRNIENNISPSGKHISCS